MRGEVSLEGVDDAVECEAGELGPEKAGEKREKAREGQVREGEGRAGERR